MPAVPPADHPEETESAAEFARQVARHRQSVERLLRRLLPRSGEQPVQRPRTPWHIGFGRSELRSFTPALRATLELVHEEAAHLHHDYIGTEHLLLGLLSQGENVAAAALMSQGVALEAVHQAVGEIIGPGKAGPGAVKGYSQRGRQVVRSALALAKQRDQAAVAPEHLLLALIEERGGVAAMVLTGLGVDLDEMQRQAEQGLSLAAPKEPPTSEDRP